MTSKMILVKGINRTIRLSKPHGSTKGSGNLFVILVIHNCDLILVILDSNEVNAEI
jgi:hypothetical protein